MVKVGENIPEGTLRDWVLETAVLWSDRLYLHEWKIQLIPSHEYIGIGGACYLWPLCQEAKIHLPSDLPEEPEEDHVQLIVHELIHVRLATITDQWLPQVLKLLPKGGRKLARELFREALEPVVDLLARVLVEVASD